MNSQEIIKECLRNHNILPKYFSRYISILNNYLNNKSLSVVEKKNHEGYAPKRTVLKLLSTGFNIEVNLDSVLFEGRLTDKRVSTYDPEEIWFFERFFERINLFREHNLSFTIEDLKVGSIYFTDMYGSLFFENNAPIMHKTGNEYFIIEYKKEVHLNLLTHIFNLKQKNYGNTDLEKVKMFMSYSKHKDKEIKEKAIKFLYRLRKDGVKNNKLDLFLKKDRFIRSLN